LVLRATRVAMPEKIEWFSSFAVHKVDRARRFSFCRSQRRWTGGFGVGMRGWCGLTRALRHANANCEDRMCQRAARSAAPADTLLIAPRIEAAEEMGNARRRAQSVARSESALYTGDDRACFDDMRLVKLPVATRRDGKSGAGLAQRFLHLAPADEGWQRGRQRQRSILC